MKPFVADIEELTEENDDDLSVIHTGAHLQLVLMALQPGETLATAADATHDQFFRIEAGWGKVIIDGAIHPILSGWAFIIPAGAAWTLVNTGSQQMKLHTLYAPPHHADRRVEHDRADTAPVT